MEKNSVMGDVEASERIPRISYDTGYVRKPPLQSRRALIRFLGGMVYLVSPCLVTTQSPLKNIVGGSIV